MNNKMNPMNYLRQTLKTVLCLLMALNVVSCSDDDDDNPSSSENSYILLSFNNASTSGSVSYALPFTLSDTVTALSTSNAIETTSDNAPTVFNFNGSLYLDEYTKSKISKWDLDDNGNFTKSSEANFSDLGYPSNICFKSSEVAFVGGPGAFKIAIFNPTTMTRTGFIDLSPVSQAGTVTDFPSAGATVETELVSEIIIRDDYLYAALYYCNMTTWMPNTKTCEIVVIDLTQVDNSSSDNSGAVVKRITDTRGSYTGGWATGGGSSFMLLDENNDIYVLCHNMWGNYSSVTGLPACVLRINDGETDFDQDYYFDVEAASSGYPVMGLEYAGNGIFFGLGQDPTQIDPTDPYSYFLDPIYNWYQFNLYTKTATRVSDVYTKAAITKSYFENSKVYLPFSTSSENYIQAFDISGLGSSQKISADMQSIIFKLK